jgi:PAS domain S-box-containing protein
MLHTRAIHELARKPATEGRPGASYMQLTLERQVAAGFAVAVGVLLLIGAGAWWSIVRFERAFGWVDHTHQVLNALEQVLLQALNVQTGSRGYALSGDPRFLQPFDRGVAEIEKETANVRRLLADNPAQLARLDRVETRLRDLVRLMQRRNELRRAGPLDDANSEEFLYPGKQAMDDIRTLIDEMALHERGLLVERTRVTQRNAALTRAALLLAIAGVLVVAAYAGSHVQREFAARRRADRALERSRAMFETLFEQATDALILADRTGVIRRINRRSEDLFGYPRAELVGRTLEQLMPERFRHRHVGHRDGYTQAPKFRAMGAGLELYGLRRSGEEFPVDIMLSPLDLEEGGMVLAAIRDITERKAAAAELQRSAERIRDLYNRAPCGYHSLDPDGLITDMNDTELEWLGYPREEVVGKLRLPDLLVPASQEVFRENFPRFKRHGAIDNLEMEFRRRDGSSFFVSLSAVAVYDEAGNYASSRSTLHDVTARRAAERRLAELNAELSRHAEELEAANRELEAFSYSVSHDLRAPLRHMAGFAALLENHPGLTLDAEARRFLGVITGSARKMGQLIDDLLAFSRLGRAPLNPTLIDSDALVRGLVRDNLFEARPATRWHIDPLPPVSADRALLTQVWINLLGNAAKYSRKSEPPEIAVTAGHDGGQIVFHVRDNGVGFDPKYAAKLFRVFSRLHPETEFAGTGVGLALVERIVARHGGRVWAASEPGRGATFSFSLPRPSAPPYPHANCPPSHPAG